MDVPYIEGQSNFINCTGKLEIYAQNTTTVESEQQDIINKIKATNPELDVKFV